MKTIGEINTTTPRPGDPHFHEDRDKGVLADKGRTQG